VRRGGNISWLRDERTSASEERREHQLVKRGENISWRRREHQMVKRGG
jgi:hypothetical protein